MDAVGIVASLPGIIGLFLLVIGVPALMRSVRELRRARGQQHRAGYTEAT